MTDDGITELALMLKKSEPMKPQSMTTGVVVSSPPNLQIRLNDVIVLDSTDLIVASDLLKGYQRELHFVNPDWGITSSENDGGQGASNHSHKVNLKGVSTPVQWFDDLKPGDEVILMPTADGQTYFVLDKAVRL